jgi:hypothetical protein
VHGIERSLQRFGGITKIVTSHWLDASGMQEISELKDRKPQNFAPWRNGKGESVFGLMQ